MRRTAQLFNQLHCGDHDTAHNKAFWLEAKSSAVAKGIGKSLLVLAPWLMKSLSVVGTLAMFLVGGGIVVHVYHNPTADKEHRQRPHHGKTLHQPRGEHQQAFTDPFSYRARFRFQPEGFIVGSIVVAAVKLVEKLRGTAH